MQCSSCEPLLDGYLEASLARRQAAQVAQHLRACVECAALLGELRVIDALLTTARPPGSVETGFTAAVVSATRESPPHPPHRPPIWLPLVAYLAVAWAMVGLLVARSGGGAELLGPLLAAQQGSLAAIGAAVGALAPAAPLVAAAVTGVLLVDLLLLVGLFYGYRRFRPLLTSHLTRGSRS